MTTNLMGERIRRAAIHLFAQKGYNATGIRDIAQRVGVTSAALYYHVGSKEDLLLSIMIEDANRLTEAGRAAVASHPAPGERLAELVRIHVTFHATRQKENLIGDSELRALSPKARRQVIERRDAYEALWAETLEQGSADGVFDLSDPHTVRLALLEMCTGVAYWYKPNGRLSLDEIVAQFQDMVLTIAYGRRPVAESLSAVVGSARRTGNGTKRG